MAYVLQKKTRGERWYASFKDATGKQVQRATGAVTKREAQRIANSWEAQAERKRNALAATEASRTVGQLAEWWLATYVSKHAAFYKTSAMVRRHLVMGSLEPVLLSEVTAARIEEFLQGKTSELSPAIVNKIRRALVTCFNRARKAGKWSDATPLKRPTHG
jgi:hypothetical protein